MQVTAALSGGVDSSVAAHLLLQAGHRVEGVFMHNWHEEDARGCESAALDAQDAYSVCATLQIPVRTLDLSVDYWQRVFEPFLEGYRSGDTPNPDVLCNREIKFRALLEQVLKSGADRLATGHYARIGCANERFQLLKGADQNKDQSYFLHLLTQDQLARLLFPLGELCKPQVRSLAAKAGLVTCDKRDSTGLCYIGERNFQDFLGRYLPAHAGEIQTMQGRLLGAHRGAWFYTVGQRHNLGIGGIKGGNGAPWYVAAKDVAHNRLYVVQGWDHPLLYCRTVRTGPLHWISGEPPRLPLRCRAQLRYRQRDQDCWVSEVEHGACEVAFDSAQRAAAPGQSIVFYTGKICLGGGCIERVISTGGDSVVQ